MLGRKHPKQGTKAKENCFFFFASSKRIQARKQLCLFVFVNTSPVIAVWCLQFGGGGRAKQAPQAATGALALGFKGQNVSIRI